MIIVCDTREQKPFDFGGKVELTTKSLVTGDYSVLGLEQEVAVERKSLQDLIGSLSSERERFDKCVQRLRGMPSGIIIVEGSMDNIWSQEFRGRMKPMSIYGSIMGIRAYGVPVIMSGGRGAAMRDCYCFLRIAYNRAQYRLRSLAKGPIIKAS